MDRKKKPAGPPDSPLSADLTPAELEELDRRLQAAPDPKAAALDAAQHFAAETQAESMATDFAQSMNDPGAVICAVCGHHNRGANKFCGMCGLPMQSTSAPGPELAPAAPVPGLPLQPASNRSGAIETHHYHHHYHHHYFQGGESAAPNFAAEAPRTDALRTDPSREERMRPNAALRGEMSRAEAAVRRITHEWVLACNTRHLDDLLDLYVPDSLVLRSNYPPVRGAAAVREFFFAALDAGLGDVEVEPLRVDVAGDLAYEAGRWKALVPSATGKRREERGKYLWVCARQNNGEWKLAADCWSSDLTFTTMESDVPSHSGVRTREPRKP